ncbi:Mur ligase family protein [Propionibacteriaceae bacterium Y2011]|uniref:Mur ligase family protein n=1 Tax=Microlunatus sp. Y2014 TaxID=3418488 RepID=UPI003B4A435E
MATDEHLTVLPAATGTPDPSTPVTRIQLDSRRVGPGEVWVALPGQRTHGAQHAAPALAAPAVAIVTDPAGAEILAAAGDPVDVPVLVTDDPRGTMARFAARLQGHPAERLLTFGMTGTTGKTTTTFLLQAALRAAGHRVGLLGTVGFRVDDRPLPGVGTTTVTTPESPDLQAILTAMVDEGADSLTMEVSSHALALQRVDGITFDVAGFTNLGVDHLDFHGDVASYFAVKATLFTPERARAAVINIDDEYGRVLAGNPQLPCTTVSLDDPEGADVGVVEQRYTDAGREVTFAVDGRRLTGVVSLPGEHNVRNALLALGMLHAAARTGHDIDLAAAVTGFAAAAVPGRMETVPLPDPPRRKGTAVRPAPRVIVDFAHTAQAVAAAGRALVVPIGVAMNRGSAAGPVVVVVGAGGDRDHGKRGPIGAAAAGAGDIVVVTDDNPRSEDPAVIRGEVLAGAQQAIDAGARATRAVDGGDRRAAIRIALELATPADAAPGTVLLLGRGHETHQETATGREPFSDGAEAVAQWQAITGAKR